MEVIIMGIMMPVTHKSVPSSSSSFHTNTMAIAELTYSTDSVLPKQFRLDPDDNLDELYEKEIFLD